MIKLLKTFLQLKVKELSAPSVDASKERLFNCIKSIENGSNKISTWSLSIVAGSLLAILSNEYNRPEDSNLKIIYLLFVIGWVFIGISFFNGKNITQRAIASELYKEDKDQLSVIFTACNTYYRRQVQFFNLALLVFGIWLLLFLLWWIGLNNYIYN